ncbi:MAG: hypothetical protein ACLFR1_06010 [Spirochaetia bacterium]
MKINSAKNILQLPRVLEKNLKPGVKVSITVLKKLSKNSYEISVKGNRFIAETQVALHAKQNLQAVTEFKHNRLTLRLINPKIPSLVQAFLKSADLPTNDQTSRIVKLMISMNIKLDVQLVQQVYDYIQRKPEMDTDKIRLLIEFLRKGIEPEYESVFYQFDPVDSHYNKQGNSSNQGKKEKQEDEKKDKQEQAALYMHHSQQPENGIQYLNHIKSGKMHWVQIPIKTSKTSANGYCRLLINTEINTVEKSVIVFIVNNHKYGIIVSKDSKVVFFPENQTMVRKKQQQYSEFAKKMYKKGLNIVDIVNMENFTGFEYAIDEKLHTDIQEWA